MCVQTAILIAARGPRDGVSKAVPQLVLLADVHSDEVHFAKCSSTTYTQKLCRHKLPAFLMCCRSASVRGMDLLP